MRLLKYNFVFILCSLVIPLSSFAAPAFWKEGTDKRLADGAPSAVQTLADGTTAIFYGDEFSIHIATSSDGLMFAEDAYVDVISISTDPALDDTRITSCDIMLMTGPQYRMTYAAESSTGVYSFKTATSADSVTWSTSTIAAYMIGTGTTFIDSPVIISTTVSSTEVWYMYYTRDSNGGNDEADYTIACASSTDNGASWTEVSASVITEQSRDPDIIALNNGSYRLYYIADTNSGDDFGSIRSALTADLVTFTTDTNPIVTRSSTNDRLSLPRAVKLSDGYSYRLYYGYELASGTTNTLSLRTTAPFLVSISPAFGSNDGTVDFVVSGEIFDDSPSVKLSHTGQSDITATNISRTNDMTITGTFDITSQATDAWDVVVTNTNGESDTLSDGFTIQAPEIPTGSVDVSENVFDPNMGQQASISYTIFGEGKVTIKIYTMIGELVKTLVDTSQTSGSYTSTWNGKNSHNDTVASGIYLVYIKAPSIEKIKKIAVVK